jgi:hypothetical protein
MVTSYYTLSKIEKLVLIDDSREIQVPYEDLNINKSQEKDISKINLIDVAKLKDEESQQK